MYKLKATSQKEYHEIPHKTKPGRFRTLHCTGLGDRYYDRAGALLYLHKTPTSAVGAAAAGASKKTGYVKVINTGSGARADSIVHQGQKKNTGTNVNKLETHGAISFSLCGAPNKTYLGKDIYFSDADGYPTNYTPSSSQTFRSITSSGCVRLSTSTSQTVNLCTDHKGWAMVNFAGLPKSTWVKGCSLNTTTLQVSAFHI